MAAIEPTSARGRELRGRHPLYARLSGDVVWVLFEDLGLDAEACGRAMDEFIAQMGRVLEAMDCLDRGEARSFVLGNVPETCACCRSLAGHTLSASGQAWTELLPPFAVGCPVECLPLQTDEAEQNTLGEISGQHHERPVCPLLCPLLEKS